MYAVKNGSLPVIKTIIDQLSREQAKAAIECKQVGVSLNCLEIAEQMKSSSKVEIWTYLWNCCKNVD